MLFDVIGYDNQILGQVEASDSPTAWAKAGLEYSNILDVRPTEVRPLTYGEWKYHAESLEAFIREQKLWGEFLVWREKWESLHPPKSI